MKNFDESRAERRNRPEEERSFQLHGHTFLLRQAVRPEVLTVFDEVGDATAVGDTMTILDDLFYSLVEPRNGDHDAYKAAREDEDDPVTLEDLNELIEWMIEQVTGRPTGSPSDSSAGRGRRGTSSTAGSSSPATPAASKV